MFSLLRKCRNALSGRFAGDRFLPVGVALFGDPPGGGASFCGGGGGEILFFTTGGDMKDTGAAAFGFVHVAHLVTV